MPHKFAEKEAPKHKCCLCKCAHYPSCQSETEDCCDNCLNGATGDHVIIQANGIGIVDTYDTDKKCIRCDGYFGEDDQEEDCPCDEDSDQEDEEEDKHDKTVQGKDKTETKKPVDIKCIHCQGPLKGKWTGTKACGKCCTKLYEQCNGCEQHKLKTELRHVQQEEWDIWHCPKCQITCNVCQAAWVLYHGDLCTWCKNKHKELESSLCDKCGTLTKDIKLTRWEVVNHPNLRYCDKCREAEAEYERKDKMEAESKMLQARQDVEIAKNVPAKTQKRKRSHNKEDDGEKDKQAKTAKKSKVKAKPDKSKKKPKV